MKKYHMSKFKLAALILLQSVIYVGCTQQFSSGEFSSFYYCSDGENSFCIDRESAIKAMGESKEINANWSTTGMYMSLRPMNGFGPIMLTLSKDFFKKMTPKYSIESGAAIHFDGDMGRLMKKNLKPGVYFFKITPEVIHDLDAMDVSRKSDSRSVLNIEIMSRTGGAKQIEVPLELLTSKHWSELEDACLHADYYTDESSIVADFI